MQISKKDKNVREKKIIYKFHDMGNVIMFSKVDGTYLETTLSDSMPND